MKVIFVGQQPGEIKSFILKGWARVFLITCLLSLPILLAYYGYQLSSAQSYNLYTDNLSRAWAEKLAEQSPNVQKIKQETQTQLETLTMRLAQLQVRLIQLDALGVHLTTIAELDDGEFDFTQQPAVGGPEIPVSKPFPAPDFVKALETRGLLIREFRELMKSDNNLP